MKKLLAMILTVTMLLGIAPLTGFTAIDWPEIDFDGLFHVAKAATIVDSDTCDAEGDGSNLTWTLDSDGILIISGNGKMASYDRDIYMDDFDGRAPWRKYTVKTAEIQKGATSIGSHTFYNCASLMSVTIPDSVTSIEYEAFYGCTSLASVTIPDSVSIIESSAFCSCTSLTDLTLSDSVTNIGSFAFTGCESLASVTIPDSVKSIELGVFGGCTSLVSVIIEEGIKSIESYVFSNCNTLNDVFFTGSETSWKAISIKKDGNEALEKATIHFNAPNVNSSTPYKIGDHIQFGTYPQSLVTDDNLINKLDSIDKCWKSFDYYCGTGDEYDGKMTPDDYMKFADFFYGTKKYRAVTFSEFRPIITGWKLGQNSWVDDWSIYKTDTVYYFEYEPIQWRVLDPSKGLILCELVVDSQAFNNTIYIYEDEQYQGENLYYQDSSCKVFASDYSASSIRAWLNDNFLNTAFTDSQKQAIAYTTLDNCSVPYEEKFSYPNSRDKVFLLSVSDVTNSEYGFASADKNDNARKTSATQYAWCQGVQKYDLIVGRNYSDWLLRTPVNSSRQIHAIDAGYVSSAPYRSTAQTDHTSLGIRPACVLSELKSDTDVAQTLYSEKQQTKTTLTYDFNGGIWESDPTQTAVTVDIEDEKPITLQSFDITKSGYVFGGWGRTAESQTGYAAGTEYHVTGEETLYAIWLTDTDGDGFADTWEMNGMDTDGDGYTDISLKAMGADPDIPDIFVQVDWMVIPAVKYGITWRNEKSLKPSESAMEMVYHAFNAHGIHIHIDCGPDSVDYANGSKSWGTLGSGSAVEYTKAFDCGTYDLGNNDFENWINFANLNFTEPRRKVFHHCLFVNKFTYQTKDANGQIITKENISGLSAGVPGQYFMVAAGLSGFDELGNVKLIDGGNIAVAGTFMHELGHNLGLGHGGDYNANYNPNHISIMNYSFQLTGLRTVSGANFIDYSDYQLDDLNEVQLNENTGVDSAGLLSGTGLMTTWKTKKNKFDFVSAEGAIDFNEDGQTQDSVRYELNGNKINDPEDISRRTTEFEIINDFVVLRGFDDWAYLVDESGAKSVYYGPTISNQVNKSDTASAGISALKIDELTFEEAIKDGLLASPGTVNIETKCDTYFADRSSQKLFLELVNYGARDLEVDLSVSGEAVRNGNAEDVYSVKGTYGSVGSVTVPILLSDNLSPGSYTLICKATGNGVNEIEKTITVNIVEMTEEIKEKIISLNSDEREEMAVLSSDVIDQAKRIVQTVPQDKILNLGDIDGDTVITPGDARLALRASVGLERYAEGSAEFLAADVNYDGKIGSDDARLILRASVGLEDPAEWYALRDDDPLHGDEVVGGGFGDGLLWEFVNTGVLTISGNGDMPDYDGGEEKTPWNDLEDLITEIVIEEGITSIGAYSFGHLPNLKDVSISESVKTIGEAAFESCSSLAEISVPEGVTDIGEWAFASCGNLTEVSLPYSLHAISRAMFRDCGSLKTIILPIGITEVGNYAFCECTTLESVFVPEGVIAIGEGAFQDCNNLRDLDLPESLTTIGDNAIPAGAVIGAISGSYAMQWAQNNGHEVVEWFKSTSEEA